MNASRDPIHDQLVATYQSLEASVLDRVLVQHGITEVEKRRSILESFLFEQGVTLDQCWFKENGRRYFPGVYFATAPHDQLDEATVHLPCPEYGMNFHEYAHGAADWALEHGGEGIETGSDSV